MQYRFIIKFTDLEDKGISRPMIGLWYTTAKQLCKKQLLYVTLDNKLPINPEDVIGYVSDIHILPGRDFITVKIETFSEIQDDIITDAKEFIETMSAGGDYDATLGKFGKYITLYKVKNRWHKRTYIVKEQ